MEGWQTKFICDNLKYLTENIQCGNILIYLIECRVLSLADKEKLDTIKDRYDKAFRLLDTLMGRIHGYQHLTKVLFFTEQTGPMIRLLEGVKENIAGNQFRYCDIELNIEHYLFRNVLYEGMEVSLNDLYQELSELQRIAFKEIVDVSVFKSLKSTNELVIAEKTIPGVLPYYIKRQIVLINKLDKKIFSETYTDIFVFKNIQRHELTILAEDSIIKDKKPKRIPGRIFHHEEEEQPLTGLSSDEMFNQTRRFILLESEGHFQLIISKVNEQYPNSKRRPPVHYIKFDNGNYFLEKSTQPYEVTKYILKDKTQIPQEDFLIALKSSHPVIIFDTPGMGKSALLTTLASQMKVQHPTENVVYLEMQKLVSLFVITHSEISTENIQNVIMNFISADHVLGKFINTELFKRIQRPIHLFLDAFDEVTSEHEELALNIVKVLTTSLNSNFRIYVTSRPHKGLDLENICGSIAYGILPFELNEQIAFLVDYWENQYSLKYSDDARQFAEKLLKSFQTQVSEEERMLTGIPLQCKMLADIYSKDVEEKSYSLESSKIRLNSINDMYFKYFEQKFPGNFLQPGKCRSLDVHYKLALDLLFPEFSKTISLWNEYKYEKNLLSLGILEVNRSGVEQFVHRTFAEFLVAKFIVSNLLNEEQTNAVPTQKLVQFIFVEVLKMEVGSTSLRFYSSTNSNKIVYYKFRYSYFKNRGVIFFLGYNFTLKNCFVKTPLVVEALLKSAKNICDLSKDWITRMEACLQANSIGLHYWFTSLLEHCVECGLLFNILDNSTSLTLKGNDAEKCNVSHLEFQILLASWFCSPELFKNHCFFASRITKQALSSVCFKNSEGFLGSIIFPHFLVAMRGNYEMFENVYRTFNQVHGLDNEIISNCINLSYRNEKLRIIEKVQILEYILKRLSQNDIKNISLFTCEKVHVNLITTIVSHGVNAFEEDRNKSTIAHIAALYSSPVEYENLVNWLVENNYAKTFTMKNNFKETPVHYALKHIEMTNDTIDVLANQCDVNFNNKNKHEETEFFYAIQGGRSIKVLQKLVENGADINARDYTRCTALCAAVEFNNLEALEYLLRVKVDPNFRCSYGMRNIWGHVFRQKDVNTNFARLLIKYKTNTNSLCEYEGFSKRKLEYERASVLLKTLNLDFESKEIIRQNKNKRSFAYLCMANTLCFACALSVCMPCFCYICYKECTDDT